MISSLFQSKTEGGAGPSSLGSDIMPETDPALLTKSDIIAQHVYREFIDLKGKCGVDLGKVILAAFVIENASQATFNVVSIGTG